MEKSPKMITEVLRQLVEELKKSDKKNDISNEFQDELFNKINEIEANLINLKTENDELKTSTTIFKTFADNSVELISRFDKNLKHIYINETAARAGGLLKHEYIGKTISEAGVPEKTAKHWESRIITCFETGKIIEVEDSIKTPEGIKYYSSKFIPEFDSEGKIISVLSSSRVISNLKKSEKELKDSNQRLLDTFESMTEAFISLDKNWCYTYMNKNAGIIFNRDPGKIIGKHIWTDFPEGIGQSFKHTYEEAMQTQKPKIFEDFFKPFNKWFENRIFPSPKGLSIFLTDITARKNTEIALINSEKRFRAITEQAAVGIAQVSIEGKWLYVNEKLCQIVGYTKDELLVLTFQDITHPDDLQKDLSLVKKVLSGEISTYSMEKRYIRKDNSIVWIKLTVSLVTELADETKYFISIIEDIDDRKLTREALIKSEERYAAFIKQSSDSICLFELEHKPVDINLPINEQIDMLYEFAIITESNQMFATSHGYKEPQETYGLRIGQVYPRLAKQNIEFLSGFITGGYKIPHFETIELKKDGSLSYFLNSLIGCVEENNLIRIWGAKQDITRIKKAENEIRQFNQELELRVKERTNQLLILNKELESFSYSVSHDLRAPLRAISGFTNILKEDYLDKFDSQGQQYMNIIVESTQRMGNLIDDLLRLSRISKQDLIKNKINTQQMVEKIFEEIAYSDNNKNLKVIINNLCDGNFDHSLIKIAFTNLISNAIKFSSKKTEQIIEIGCYKTEDSIVYFVKDNGVGINMAYSDKLFQVFQRLHARDEFEGTGIGLAIVKRIINKHGGEVWVESEIGKGAKFHFSIPL